jgi:hypothetical protein
MFLDLLLIGGGEFAAVQIAWTNERSRAGWKNG